MIVVLETPKSTKGGAGGGGRGAPPALEALNTLKTWKLGNLRFRPKSGRKCALHLFAQDGQGRAQNFERFNP